MPDLGSFHVPGAKVMSQRRMSYRPVHLGEQLSSNAFKPSTMKLTNPQCLFQAASSVTLNLKKLDEFAFRNQDSKVGACFLELLPLPVIILSGLLNLV